MKTQQKKNKYFGTDGIRLNAYMFDRHFCFSIGKFLGNYNNKKNKILIARDTRESGEQILNDISDGLYSSGAEIYNLDISTTPSMSYLLQEEKKFDFGIMISASHNPYTDNGIKIFSKGGSKISDDLEYEIEEYIDNNKNNSSTNYYGKKYVCSSKNLLNKYIIFLSQKYKFNNTYKILIDCAHGSTSLFAKTLFKECLHQNVEIINDDYNGKDINKDCGSTHIDCLINHIKEGNYDIGFSFDGDGDRLICVSKKGVVCDGDFQLYLNAKYLKDCNRLINNQIVLTSMSNIGLKYDLDNINVSYIIVDVGDKYVEKALADFNLNLGGEQSGHIIHFDDLCTGDGLLSAIYMLNIISYYNASLDDLIKDLHVFPQILHNIKAKNKHENYNKIISDVRIKKILKDIKHNEQLLIRESGTEPLIRISVSSIDSKRCHEILNNVTTIINKILQS